MPSARLERRLGLAAAVTVGVGSMIGAGVFVVWGPAVDAAGSGLLVALVLAGIVAFCNATSSAQLAARHPESGGTYVYARERLGAVWGFTAGWAFVVGKTASVAAGALVVGAYVWPGQERLVAVLSLVGITAVNIGGLSRTVTVTRLILVVAALALIVAVVSGIGTGPGYDSQIWPDDIDPAGTLQAAGFLFFAFAGYARIATLGEEVRDPETIIPRAVTRALAMVLVVYAIVAITVGTSLPLATIVDSDAPLAEMTSRGPFEALTPFVRIGAGVAALGVLLNLIPGISRTVMAMARRREMPTWFSHVDHHRSLPIRAELTLTAIVIAVVLVVDVRSAIGASGVAILLYYAITNAAALRLDATERIWPRALMVIGLVGCTALGLALPREAILVAIVGLAVGHSVRFLVHVRRR